MAVVLYIKWSMEGEITDHTVIEVSDSEKEKLVKRNIGNPNPKYCEVSQAFRYGLQVETEPVEKKVKIKQVEEEILEEVEEVEVPISKEEKPKKVILAKSEIKE
jgi:hypothetical protein